VQRSDRTQRSGYAFDLGLLWKKDREKSVQRTGTGNRWEVSWLQTGEQDRGTKGLFMLREGTNGGWTLDEA
jgi:hypothetical protein